MRSTLRHRSLRSPSWSPPISAPFVCLRCRSLASRLPPPLTRRYATNSNSPSSNPPLNESAQRIRQRIWGTANPPGQRDPYAPLTPEERARDEALKAQEVQKQADADIVKDAEAEYVPATSGEGLERIGGPTGWWEEEWDRENVYRGFLTEKNIIQGESAATVRRVLIELLALQEEGRSLSDCSKASLDRNEHLSYAGVDVMVADDGTARLGYKDPVLRSWLMESLEPEKELKDSVLDSTTEANSADLGEEGLVVEASTEPESNVIGKGTVADSSSASAEENVAQEESETVEEMEVTTLEEERNFKIQQALAEEAQVAEQERSWLEVSLKDLDFKFAFVKRLMSLTGVRIHDPKISEFSKLGDVVAYLSEKPKPKKLVDMLLADSQLMALPNVEVFERRHTPIDKEKEVGRWKLIEAELSKRGLPVTGHRVS